MQRKTPQAADSGRKQDQNESGTPNGSERARDEQRAEGGPRYGGEAWAVADARGENRFGKARNDDADPLEMVKAGADPDAMGEKDSEDESAAREVEPDGDAEPMTAGDAREPGAESGADSGGDSAGMGRGEKPRKPKSRAKK